MTRHRVPALAVVGYKNTGKTTLVSHLVAAFKARGYRVGTCKHDGGHELRFDAEGTDSWQHRQSGADVTLVASGTQAALQRFYEQEPPLEHWLEQLSDPALALDLILVEGWKRSYLPKLVMLGDEKNEQLSNVIGYVRNSNLPSIAEGETPVYDRGDAVALVELILDHVIRDVT